MPLISWNLKWSHELRERLLKHRSSFKHINHGALQTDEATRNFDKYDTFVELLDAHDKEIFSHWTQDLCDLCDSHLGQPILKCGEDGLYETNFDPKYIGNLDFITQWFNGLQKTILPVERELIDDELNQIYETLEPALTLLTWQMPDLDDYIGEA